jgi:hypothetical protein
VFCHLGYGALTPDIEKLAIVRGIELQNGGAELETLCPFGPPPAGVLTADGVNWRSACRVPSPFQRFYLGRRQIENAARLAFETGNRNILCNFHAEVLY